MQGFMPLAIIGTKKTLKNLTQLKSLTKSLEREM